MLVVLVAALASLSAGLVVLAARNRVFFRLGVRNARRRPGRTALIVAGSMLGTTIIAAALATGDTMSQTIRSSAVAALGRADEVVAARGVDAPARRRRARARPAARYFPEAYAARIARAARHSGLVDGVAPVIVEPIAVQDVSTRQNEPRVTLFASEPRLAARLRRRYSSDVGTVSLADLRPGEVYLNAEGRGQARRPGGRHAANSRRAHEPRSCACARSSLPTAAVRTARDC